MSQQPTSKDPAMPLGQRCVSELLGTFLLVFIVAGAGASAKLAVPGVAHPRAAADLIFLGLSNGLALFFIIMIVGKISGVQINPGVTIGLASIKRFPWKEVPAYLAAQFVGAVIGAGAVYIVFGHDAVTVGHLGATTLADGVSLVQGLAVEGIGLGVLFLTIVATAEDPRAPSGWAAFAIGMTLATLVMLLAPPTGAAINPARAFGPDLVDAFFGVRVDWGAYLVCYLIGPLIGSITAGWLYGYIAKMPAAKPKPES